jgi:hypothetical protein
MKSRAILLVAALAAGGCNDWDSLLQVSASGPRPTFADAGVCPSGQVACSSGCTSIQNDPNNCGSCGRKCQGQCQNGSCNDQVGCMGCPPTALCCNNSCIQRDNANCTACGAGCPNGQQCQVDGAGVAQCSSTCVDAQCGPNGMCCNDVCTDVSSDQNNCGGCGAQCPPGQNCMNRNCVQPGQPCSQLLGCVMGCANDACVSTCMQQGTPNGRNLMMQLYFCYQKQVCYSQGNCQANLNTQFCRNCLASASAQQCSPQFNACMADK